MEWTSLVLLDNLYLYHITTLIASLSLQTSWGRRLIYSNLLLNSCQWLMRHLTISSSVQKTLKEQKLRTINCVSIHYRNVDEKSWDLAGRRVNDVLNGFSCLRLTHGCKVLEVRPVINWDKGKAGTFLLESLGFNNCNNVLPIYIDDDQTDEDAFKVLRDGNKGYGILVSSEPKESNTICSRRDP